MATNQDFVEYHCSQAGLGDAHSCRKMFGEYAWSLHGKVVALACDNLLYLKPTDRGRALLGDVAEHPPYPGAVIHNRRRAVHTARDRTSRCERPIMKSTAFTRSIFSTMLLTAASPAFAIECFSMYDAKNALVYQSSSTPIDLSRSISEQMARRFPARYLVISDVGACPATVTAAATTPTQAAALLPGSTGEGPGAFGADATSPAPSSRDAQATSDFGPVQTFARAPAGGRR